MSFSFASVRVTPAASTAFTAAFQPCMEHTDEA